MKIMRLSSGMANTMFQYVTYMQLKKMYPNDDVYVDTMWFDYSKYPYDLKRAFDIDVDSYDFYQKALKEAKIDYANEIHKLQKWDLIGCSTWTDACKCAMNQQLVWHEGELPELYNKAGYGLKIVLLTGEYSITEVYDILCGKQEKNRDTRSKLKEKTHEIVDKHSMIYMIERAIRLPDKRKKLFSDIFHGRKPDFTGHPSAERLQIEGNVYYCTYGNPNDFVGIEDEIRKVFTFVPFEADEVKNIELAKKISGSLSVSIHARAADMEYGMASALHRNYYGKAVNYIEKKCGKNVIYYIFSDKPNWVRNNLELLGMTDSRNYCIVDHNDGDHAFRDMQLMSMCRHNICAQSTFSWWGGWLNQNPDKIVVTPYETYSGTISF